jgi:DNA-binding NarL/FixJ family response regulator
MGETGRGQVIVKITSAAVVLAGPTSQRTDAPNLTAFEISVLQWLSFGKRADEIAEILESNENAMKQRIFRIKNKLGANTTAGAIGIAFRSGLIK